MKFITLIYLAIILFFFTGKDIKLLKVKKLPTKKEYATLTFLKLKELESKGIHLNSIKKILKPDKYYVFKEGEKIKYAINAASNPEFVFKIDDIKVVANQYLKIKGGYIAGFDWGEFGGGIFLFNDKKEKTATISKFNSRGLVRFDGQIYAIVGMDHFKYSNCFLLKITNRNNKWVRQISMAFENEIPHTISFLNKKNLIVSTNNNLYNLSVDNWKKTKIKNIEPHFLEASSSIINYDKSILYLGMSNGIYRLDLKNTEKRDWLTE